MIPCELAQRHGINLLNSWVGEVGLSSCGALAGAAGLLSLALVLPQASPLPFPVPA